MAWADLQRRDFSVNRAVVARGAITVHWSKGNCAMWIDRPLPQKLLALWHSENMPHILHGAAWLLFALVYIKVL